MGNLAECAVSAHNNMKHWIVRPAWGGGYSVSEGATKIYWGIVQYKVASLRELGLKIMNKTNPEEKYWFWTKLQVVKVGDVESLPNPYHFLAYEMCETTLGKVS